MSNDVSSSGTGATNEQIETASRNRYQTTSAMAERHPWSGLNPELRQGIREVIVRDAAQWLVPPTHRIVSVDDLTALFDAYDFLVHPQQGDRATMVPNRDAIDRIRALIGGE